MTVAGALDSRRLMFEDECGTQVSLATIPGYSPVSVRMRLEVPRNRGRNSTLLSNRSIEKMGLCLVVEESTTAEILEILACALSRSGA
jgi:hypothetical protein